MIVVIDYNVGNVKSVCNAFRYIGYLIHRKKYTQGNSAEVQEKVMKSYDSMVSRSRSRRSRSKARAASGGTSSDTNAA